MGLSYGRRVRAALVVGSVVGVIGAAWAPAAHATTPRGPSRHIALAGTALTLGPAPIPALKSKSTVPLPKSGPPPIPDEDPDPLIGSDPHFNGSGGAHRHGTLGTNWSGQIDAGTRFTLVVGRWTVPAVEPSTSPRYASEWIGIGGNTINELIQTGTTTDTVGGVTSYSAWYELLPTHAVTIQEPVSPGDAMSAKIEETSKDRWYIGLEDVTKGWTATRTFTYTAGSASSAEWIVERPEVTTRLSTLADFGSVRFQDLRIAGTDPTTTSLTAVEMTNTAGRIVAYPGKVTSTTTTTFTDYYGSPATSSPTPPAPPRVTTPPRATAPPVTPPTVTSLTPSIGPTAGATVVTITGTNLTGASAVDFGATAASFRVTSTTRITARSPSGTGTVYVTVTTPGGTSTLTTAGEFSYLTPLPAVGSVRPRAGPTAGGTVVTITGTNLTGASVVHFGGSNAATFRVTSATRITATSPAHTAGSVRVSVTTPGGTSVASDDLFDYLAPRVAFVSPREGPLRGGTVVTIIGTNFVRGARVRFGKKAATRVTVVNPTRIVAKSPAGTGTVNVTVTVPGGTSVLSPTDVFRYLP
jgi:hypothetical protein